MSHWYTIDDDDLQVAYSGSWDVIRGGGHYNGGAHSTGQLGATATLIFKGTGIKVWMSVPTGDWNQISGYHIKGDFIERHIECKAVPGYNELTFIREGLGEGPHTIVITQEGINGSPRGGAPIQLDRIEVLTSPSDPNPAPIYPAGVSPPNSNPPPANNPPANNPPANTPPPNTRPATSSNPTTAPPQPTSSVIGTSSTPRQSQQNPADSAANVVETAVVVTSGSSTFTVATTIPISRSTVEFTSLDKDGQPMITKVIPDRVYTTTDSTGGVAVRTEYVEVGGSKSSGPSTGLLVGVIVAVLGLLVCVAAVGLLLWRRKKRRRNADMSVTGSFGEHFVQNRGVAMGQVNPFTLHGQEQSPSPSTSNPFSPHHSRDVSTTYVSTEADPAPEEAPPAYRLSQGPTGLSIGKEQANLLRL